MRAKPLAKNLIDPNDPLHDSIESVLAGLSPMERALKLDEMFSPKESPTQNNQEQDSPEQT